MVATSNSVTFWTDRKIPFEFEADYPYRDDVLKAMALWEQSGVWFCQRGNEPNYVVVRNTSGSSNSVVGMSGQSQSVYIGDGYKSLHELGHTLGLIHEQERSDRDTYVIMQWNEIENGMSNDQMVLDPNSRNVTVYDRVSVMHYPAPAGGWGGLPDQTVWTMRWRADQSLKLGAGPNQGWETLGTYDSAGLATLYRAVPGWGNQSRAPEGGTTNAPRTATFRNKIWQVWKGSNDEGIWYATYDGVSWSPQARISGVGTSDAPAICVYGDALWIVWRGIGSDTGLWYAQNDGSGWTGQWHVPEAKSSHGPAIAAFNGALYICWRGETLDRIWMLTLSGAGWSGQSVVPNTGTSSQPALAASQNLLYLAWKGGGNDDAIYLATSSGGGFTGQAAVPNFGTASGPALADYDGKLWMAWRGAGDNNIWWANHSASSGWSGQACIRDVGTEDSPTLAAHNNKLRLAWSGLGHDGLWQALYPVTS
jgi:hypothetical protein